MQRALYLLTIGLGLASLQCESEKTAHAGNERLTPRTPASVRAKEPTTATRRANAAVLHELPFADRQDFEDVRRGFLAKPTPLVVKDKNGRIIWSMEDYGFENAPDAPPTVNPSLWRQAQLNSAYGLFKAADHVYQLRGFDLSNMDVIEGETGLIVVDPLISAETAKAALDFYYANRPRKPVVAVIYTHSHVDHFGGVLGVVNADDVAAGKVKIIAPVGFLEHAASENVNAGNVMSRRAEYMYGALLPKGPTGQVDTGLGKNTSTGTTALIAPTETIALPHDRRTIDGVDIEFQLTPGTEAPSEMNFFLPQSRVLCAAENATHTQHNLVTLRGAQVRDAKAWSKYLDEAIELFGSRADVLIAQHHWPTFGQDRIVEFLADQRDMYRYIHDQSLRLANKGYTPLEIAEALRLPESLSGKWYTRGYYGSVSQNARGVYQKYLGFYDGNPSTLNPLPPVEAAKKYVEYMGGEQAVLKRAREDFARGDYRWTAQVLNQVVFANPEGREGRELLADTLEQLGYQAENGTWRNVYLQGALELRRGVPDNKFTTASEGSTLALTVPMIFDYLAVRLDPDKAANKRTIVNFEFPDAQSVYGLRLSNSALSYVEGKKLPHADASITLTRPAWDAILTKQTTLAKAIMTNKAKVEGDIGKVSELFSMIDDTDPRFNIVTP